jgi:hypothetical protein
VYRRQLGILGFLHRHPKLESLLIGVLPGLLAGSQLACLLFFLNPDLPFRWGNVGAAMAYYGSLGAALSWPLLQLASRGRLARARRVLPWALTLALGLVTALDWVHASRYAFYLPPGINSRLIKTAVWLSVGTLAIFYTALLHAQQRRRYGPRSRLGIALISLLSLVVAVERRDAYYPREQAARTSVLRVSPNLARPRLVVVGVEGMTLDAVLPLAEQGRVPFLAASLRSGAVARLEALSPNRRLPAWTTLSTGKYPFRHQVMTTRAFPVPWPWGRGELRLLPALPGFSWWGVAGQTGRPLDRLDQRALSLTQILGRLGFAAGQVGWPDVSPMPEEARLALAEAFFHGHEGATVARPETLAQRAELFAVSPAELDAVTLSRFGNAPPPFLRQALAEDRWRETLGLFLLDQEPRTDALFLALPGLAAVSKEAFGGFEAVQLEGREGEAERQAAELVAAYYGHVDAFLQEVWNRLKPVGGLLAVVAPSGSSEARGVQLIPHLLSGRRSIEGARGTAPDGLLLLRGPGVDAGKRIEGASVVDMVPTLLYALGYPIARDLDGKTLAAIMDPDWRSSQPVTFVPSYESLAVATNR